jgi:hypothetical protein
MEGKLMNCPNCNAYNEPGSQFCMNCGYALGGTEGPGPVRTGAGSALWIATGQAVLAVLGLYLIRAILMRLSFVQEMRFPGVGITPAEMLSMLIFVLILVIILVYARRVSVLWPLAFPAYAAVAVLVTAVLYVIALSVLYGLLKPVFAELFFDPEPLLIVQIFLTLVALAILARAAILVYNSLPAWLENMRRSMTAVPQAPAKTKED